MPRKLEVNKHIFEILNQVFQTRSEATALVQGQRQLSYRQLNNAVTHLSEFIDSLLLPDTVTAIPVMAERSLEFIVAALACWKSGYGYLPIAVDTPIERTEFILSDISAPFVLVNQGLGTNLKSTQIQNWQLSVESTELTPFAIKNESQLAYVIYTSGTTGHPKGCGIGFESLSPMIEAFSQYFAINGKSRTTFGANVAFDAAVIEMWPALTQGGCVYIVDQQVLLNPSLLVEFYREHAITFSWLPTPLAEVLMQDSELSLPDTLEVYWSTQTGHFYLRIFKLYR